LYIDFTSNLKIETENLLSIIDSSDFSNLENFKVAVRDYELVTELSEAELYAWEVYTDVFIHSFEYWDNNLDSWAQLIGGSETTTLGSDCTEGGWFRRTWCKIKNFVLSDASGAAGEVLVAFAFNNPIVFGGVVVAGLSSSAGAAIWNIVKNLL